MAAKHLSPVDRSVLRFLRDADYQQPGGFHTLQLVSRKVRDALVTQGYIEMHVGRALTTYRITAAGRSAVK